MRIKQKKDSFISTMNNLWPIFIYDYFTLLHKAAFLLYTLPIFLLQLVEKKLNRLTKKNLLPDAEMEDFY